MKKIITLISLVAMLGIGNTVFAAVKQVFQPTILPVADSTYELGTSTRSWLRIHSNEYCLLGDCITAWPTGGSGWSTTSAAYWDSTVSRWSTTSDDYNLSLYSKGFFWSTTSADYWETQQAARGGGGGGSGTVSTSSTPVVGQLAQWTGASTLGTIATSSLGLLTTNVAEGSNLYYTDARVNSYVHGSTTVPKLYTANTFTGINTFGTTTVSNLNGVYVVDGVRYAKSGAGLQSALNECAASGGGLVWLTDGLYSVTSEIVVPADAKCKLAGSKFIKTNASTGANGAEIRANASLTNLMSMTGSFASVNGDLSQDFQIENVYLNGNNNVTNVLYLKNTDTVVLKGVRITGGTKGIATVYEGVHPATSSSKPGGLMIDGPSIIAVRDNVNGINIDLQDQTQVWISNVWFTGKASSTISVASSTKVHMSNNEFNEADVAVAFKDSADAATNDITINNNVFAMGAANYICTDTRTNSQSNRVTFSGNTYASGLPCTLRADDGQAVFQPFTTLNNGNFNIMPNGTGKVGIGTTTPQQLLHVSGTGATLRVDATDGLTPQIQLNRTGSGQTDWRINNAAGVLNFTRSTNEFSTAVTSDLTISATGLLTAGYASTTGITASYASSTAAHFGTLTLPNLGTAAGSFLAVNATGQVIATSTPTGGTGDITGITLTGNTTGMTFSGSPCTSGDCSFDMTGVLGMSYGGTGTSTLPTYGKILVGNAANGYDLVATSSLGISSSLSGGTAGMLSAWTSSSALTATGTPTFAAFTSTSTATSTMQGALKLTGNVNTGTNLIDSAILGLDNTLNSGIGLQVYTNHAAPDFAPAYIRIDNTSANVPALEIQNDGTGGFAASILARGPSPQIELYEEDQVAPAGKFEIQVQGDIFYLNGRNAANTSFDNVFWLLRPELGGSVGIGANPYNIERLTLGTTTGAADARIAIAEGAAPTADAMYGKLYVKASDSKLYFMDDGGNEFDLTAGAAGDGTWSTTSADYYVHSSTTIPKTYTANSFTANQTFGAKAIFDRGGSASYSNDFEGIASFSTGNMSMLSRGALDFYLDTNNNGTDAFKIFGNTSTNELFRVTDTGNVGVGTTSPYAKLSVVGDVVASHFVGTTTATSTFGGPGVFGGRTLQIGNAAEQAYLPSGGANSAFLVIDKPNAASDASILLASTGDAKWEIGMTGDSNLMWKKVTGTESGGYAFENVLKMDYDNLRVGIGTEAPSAKLEIASTSPGERVYMQVTNKATSGTDGTGLKLAAENDNHVLYLGTDAGLNGNQNAFLNWGSFGTGLFIDSSGNVGIQTASPVAGKELTVGGEAAFTGSGDSYFTGNLGIGTTTPVKTFSVAGESWTSATSTVYGLNVFGPTAGTSTQYIYSTASGKGGEVIMEDEDGAGCTSITTLNGVVRAQTVTCPPEI